MSALLVLVGCTIKRDLGNFRDGGAGGGQAGSGGTGSGAAGNDVGGTSGSGGGVSGGAGGSGGAAGSAGAAGTSGAAGGSGAGGRGGAGGSAAGSGGSGGGGGSGNGGGSGGGGGNGGGSGNGGRGGSDALPRTLIVVPGTGSPGLSYLGMTALEGGTVYPVVLNVYASSTLTPATVVQAIRLSNGAATTLSTSDEFLSSGDDGKSPVAIDGTYVYWFSRNKADSTMLRLRRAPKLGGAREDVTAFNPTVATAPAKPLVTATGGGYVYWSSNGNGIFRCLAAVGCGTGPERIVPTPDRIVSMVVHGNWLYWASVSTGKVWRHGLTTPGDQMLDGGPTNGPAMTCGIAVSADDTELWSIQCLYPYELRRVNVTAMTGTTIATAYTEPIDNGADASLALGTDTVYFIGSAHVFSVPRANVAATPQTLADLLTPSGVRADGIIGLDDQYLYLEGSADAASTGSTAQAGFVLRMAR
jgi:hypothetical protein